MSLRNARTKAAEIALEKNPNLRGDALQHEMGRILDGWEFEKAQMENEVFGGPAFEAPEDNI